MNVRYPIHELIETQMKQIGLGRGELALRCGFKNVAKGLRRINAICHGDINSKGATMVINALPAALEIDQSKVAAAAIGPWRKHDPVRAERPRTCPNSWRGCGRRQPCPPEPFDRDLTDIFARSTLRNLRELSLNCPI